jgi:hypothetical protein
LSLTSDWSSPGIAGGVKWVVLVFLFVVIQVPWDCSATACQSPADFTA